jgi:RNA polymerase sigma-70 factor (ECF subfamily)
MTRDRDAMLVEACLAGDRTAFGQLVDSYQTKLFYAAYRITGSTEDAMDATQGAFVKAYENLHTFDLSRRFFSWIYRIVLNEALNILDRRRSHTELEDEVPGSGENPEQTCQAEETGRYIQRALMKLSAEQRVVLVLRHFHGFSYREIGEVLGVSEKTVKSRLFTARQSLRAVLLEQGFVQ